MTAEAAVVAALQSLAAAFEELGAPAMVIGGIAVIARGVPRTTLDIDATVFFEHLDLDRALGTFGRHGLQPRVPDAARFARAHQVMLLEHSSTGTPVDVTLAQLPFEREALGRATAVDFGGATLPVIAVEDLVIYKTVAWRERDRADVERLLAAHRGEVDIDRVRRVVAEFAVLLDEPGRLAEFDALVARLRG